MVRAVIWVASFHVSAKLQSSGPCHQLIVLGGLIGEFNGGVFECSCAAIVRISSGIVANQLRKSRFSQPVRVHLGSDTSCHSISFHTPKSVKNLNTPILLSC